MKENDVCPHCGKGKLVKVIGVFPYTIDHLICIVCDSTYNIKES